MPTRAEFEPEDSQEIEIRYIDEEVPDEDIAAALSEPDPFEKANEEIRGLDGLNTGQKKRATRQINKFNRGDGAESTKVEYEKMTGYTFFEVAEPEHNLEYLAKLYTISPVHFAAVNAKVANIVGLGYEFKETFKTKEKLSEVTGDGLKRARKKVGRFRNELLEWTDSLNEENTFTETMWQVWTDVEATGNGYLEIGRRKDGRVGYVGHVPSHTMRVRLARDGYIQITSTNKVVFFHNFGQSDNPNPVTRQRKVNEIIHFKKYSTTDSYYGVADVIAAKNHIAGNEFAARFNLDFFEHKAVPRHLIVVKGGKLSLESEGRLIEFFQTGLKGKHHRTLYVPLPPSTEGANVDFKLEKVESDIQDASFVRYLDSNDDHILMAHRVPRTKVGLASGVSLAVARDADKTFKEQVCRP
jgi:capsid portal protein